MRQHWPVFFLNTYSVIALQACCIWLHYFLLGPLLWTLRETRCIYWTDLHLIQAVLLPAWHWPQELERELKINADPLIFGPLISWGRERERDGPFYRCACVQEMISTFPGLFLPSSCLQHCQKTVAGALWRAQLHTIGLYPARLHAIAATFRALALKQNGPPAACFIDRCDYIVWVLKMQMLFILGTLWSYRQAKMIAALTVPLNQSRSALPKWPVFAISDMRRGKRHRVRFYMSKSSLHVE